MQVTNQASLFSGIVAIIEASIQKKAVRASLPKLFGVVECCTVANSNSKRKMRSKRRKERTYAKPVGYAHSTSASDISENFVAAHETETVPTNPALDGG